MNLVTGNSERIAEHLIRSPIVRKVSLTGSVPVGKQILRLAADGVKKVSMELGGHAPVLVFEDADVEKAAEALRDRKVPQLRTGLHLAEPLLRAGERLRGCSPRNSSILPRP